MHVVTLKLDLGQKSKGLVLRSGPIERQKYSKTRSTQILLKILAAIGRYEPFRVVVIIFVSKTGIYNVPGISNRLRGYITLLLALVSSVFRGLQKEYMPLRQYLLRRVLLGQCL